MKYDFCGWATKNDIKCGDGRVIRKDAFKVQDGDIVPLVWQHKRDEPAVVLGHALLENRDDGVYAFCSFNNNKKSQEAKEIVQHGDIKHMSIWANDLDQVGDNVYHGTIREVSLVLAGANPGAFIESVMAHGVAIDEDETEGIVYTDSEIELYHASSEERGGDIKRKDDSDDEDETVGDVYNTFTDKQKKAVAIMITEAIKQSKNDNEEDDDEMKHNVFEGEVQQTGNFLSHADMEVIMDNARRIGSLKEAVENYLDDNEALSHAIDTTGMTVATGTQTYGVNDVDMLLPEYRNLNNPPEWISREMGWVQKVMSGVHKTPFSRIKSMYANITEDEARAKGYIKGKQKKHEVFSTLKRTTDPQTVYKLQKLDRDDIIDITDFDVVAWIKAEMRVMLDEEIARAILIGDGRQADAEDKIKEDHIRPIAKDVPLFNVTYKVSVPSSATDEDAARQMIKGAIRARKNYKGSGSPTLFTTEDWLTEALLLEDGVGHRLYKTEQELATAMRVNSIVTVEPMEDQKVTVNSKEYPLMGVIVNLKDYNVGADRGGEVNMFDDFDINFNQYQYLIETRCSGALIKPFSAITLVLDKTESNVSNPTD